MINSLLAFNLQPSRTGAWSLKIGVLCLRMRPGLAKPKIESGIIPDFSLNGSNFGRLPRFHQHFHRKNFNMLRSNLHISAGSCSWFEFTKTECKLLSRIRFSGRRSKKLWPKASIPNCSKFPRDSGSNFSRFPEGLEIRRRNDQIRGETSPGDSK